MTRRLARPTGHAHRFALAAIATASLLAACGSDDSSGAPAPDATTTGSLRPPVAVNAVGGTAGGGAAADTKMAADAASSEMSILPYWAGFTYEVGDGLPALPTDSTAYQFAAGADVDEATVAALADALGVAGDPVRIEDPDLGVLWRVGPDDGSAPSLSVNRDPQLSWYYSSAWADQPVTAPCEVAVDPALADASGGATTVVGGDAVAPVPPADGTTDPAACPTPEPPAGVPTADEAQARATELLAAIGQDPASFAFDTYADDWSASATASLLLGGVRSSVSWGFGFGGDGVLQWANGSLATPVAAGPYPLVDLDTAIARLEEQQSAWTGGVAREPMVKSDDVAAATDVVAPDAPVDTAAPEPEVATLVDVRADFWWAWDADGSVWLLPAYTFTDTEGRMHTVAAVTDEYLIVQDVPTSEPPVVEPATTEPATTEPAGGATEPPTTQAPTEPVTPSIPVDPATLIGLSVDDATAVLEAQGLTLRVVRIDGVDQAVTMDFSESRVNVATEAGVVTEVVSLG